MEEPAGSPSAGDAGRIRTLTQRWTTRIERNGRGTTTHCASPTQRTSVPDAAGDVPIMEDLTPAQIVAELDRFIIGQGDAKRAVAVALRNRFRRQLLPEEMRGEVVPKNILMMGRPGLARPRSHGGSPRSSMHHSSKSATRFTEVGYVGRDVESIVRDLCEVAIDMLHSRRLEQVKEEPDQAARQRLVDLLTEQLLANAGAATGAPANGRAAGRATAAEERRRKREQDRLLALLNEEALEEETVEIEVDPQFADSPFEAVGGMSPDELYDSFQDFLDGYAPPPAIPAESFSTGGASHSGAAGGGPPGRLGHRDRNRCAPRRTSRRRLYRRDR